MTTTVFSPFVRGILVACAIGLGVAGCSTAVDPSGNAATADTIAASALSVQSPGAGGFFLHAVDSLTLRADQQQKLTAIRAQLQQQTAPVREARAKLATEVARQVRAGAIDHDVLRPLADQVAAAAGATKPAVQQAVQQIHDMLDASQRTALVTSLRAKAAQGKNRGEMKQHLDQVATDLALTDDQRNTIHASLRSAFAAHREAAASDHVQMKARMETLAAAFESESFDAKALDVGSHGGAQALHVMGMHGAFLDAAVPVLTPAQREVLVAKIQAHMQTAEE